MTRRSAENRRSDRRTRPTRVPGGISGSTDRGLRAVHAFPDAGGERVGARPQRPHRGEHLPRGHSSPQCVSEYAPRRPIAPRRSAHDRNAASRADPDKTAIARIGDAAGGGIPVARREP